MTTHSTRLLAIGAALVTVCWSVQAAAGPGYQVTGFTTSPANAPKVLAATNKLMKSDVMKKNKNRVLLLTHLADGNDPASHSFVTLFQSTAEYESFGEKLRADSAWSEFMSSLSELGMGAGTSRNRLLRSWGEISDADVVWHAFAFRVSDPAAFFAATDRFMNSAMGKAFPGQVHLNQVVAGGGMSESHNIVVGYESEAEMEAWNDKNASNPEWLAYLAQLERSSNFLGSNLTRTIQAWGTQSMKSVVSPQ